MINLIRRSFIDVVLNLYLFCEKYDNVIVHKSVINKTQFKEIIKQLIFEMNFYKLMHNFPFFLFTKKLFCNII